MANFERHQMLFHLTLVQNLHGQIIQNGYYFTNRDLFNDNDTAAQLGLLINHFTLFIMPHLKNMQSQELVYRAMVANQVVPINGPIVESVIETSQGNLADESLPSYCAAVCTLRSGFGGKSNRGRSFYAGICETDTQGSRLSPDLLALLQNLGNQLISTFNDAAGINPFVYVIYSRKMGDSESGHPTAGGIRVIRQAIARSVLGTQRHRKIGIGN
jgi:hypothetical protein